MSQVLTPEDIERVVRRISHEIVERHKGAENVVLVGIHSRGVPLAEMIGSTIAEFDGATIVVGELDIGLYRDDRRQRPTARLGRTLVPVDLTGRNVILVDDVLYTGRTVRSALDALNDLGRPALVELAVLIDRGHRQLPIRADYVGKNIPTSPSEKVLVRLAGIDEESGVWVEEG